MRGGSGVEHMAADADPEPAALGLVGRGEDAVRKVVRTEGIALGQFERALLGHRCCLAFRIDAGHVTSVLPGDGSDKKRAMTERA